MSDTANDRKNSEQYKKYVYNSNGNETCVFYSSALDQPLDDVPWKLVNMSFKSIDSKLVLILLANHGFREVRYNISTNSQYNRTSCLPIYLYNIVQSVLDKIM